MDLAVTASSCMRGILVVGLATLLSACAGAEWNSINWGFNPTDGDSRLIDAKQRAILSVRRDVIGADGRRVIGPDGKPVKDLAVCVEPSPDALQATAAALAGAVSGETLKTALNLSVSTSESVASIGLRTQTIQLLRDAYDRLCEAFLNDGIDSIAYDVLQRRFQNQIIALLAVEQLTGTVKVGQVALNTSAAGNAGAQAGLIDQMLKTAEEDLLVLQKKQETNATELATLKETKTGLEAAEKMATDELNKSDETKKDPAFQQKAAEAKSNLEINGNEISAAERQKTTLEGQIARKNQQIATLTVAFGEAANATITSNATAMGAFGGDGTTSNTTHASDVVNAVRAITLNAINQDYEAQVCFEALRYRNNVGQFKNEVNRVFDSQPSTKKGKETIFAKVPGTIFTAHCRELFRQQVKLRGARAKLIEARASNVTAIIKNVGDKISPTDAAKLILALSQASPTEPGAAFLSRAFKIGGGDGGDPGSPEEFVATIQNIIQKALPTNGEPSDLEKIIADLGKEVGKEAGKEIGKEVAKLNAAAEDLENKKKADEQARDRTTAVLRDEVGKEVKKLNKAVKKLEKKRAASEQLILKGVKNKEVVVPINIQTTTKVGPSSLVLKCEKGEKANAEGTECVARCGRGGVEYDEESDECVPEVPAKTGVTPQ